MQIMKLHHWAATIISVTKQSTITCVNDFCPVALTSIIIPKFFKRVVKDHIISILPPLFDSFHLHTSPTAPLRMPSLLSLEHFEQKNSHVLMLFLDLLQLGF